MTNNMYSKITTILIGLAVLIVGGVVVTREQQFGAVDTKLTEVPKLTTTKIGDKYVHIFKNNKTGEIKEVEITKEEYTALGLKDAPQPILEGYKWVNSGVHSIMNTENTILKDYQYFITDTSSTTAQVKTPDYEKEIPAEYIIDDKLTEQGLLELTK